MRSLKDDLSEGGGGLADLQTGSGRMIICRWMGAKHRGDAAVCWTADTKGKPNEANSHVRVCAWFTGIIERLLLARIPLKADQITSKV